MPLPTVAAGTWLNITDSIASKLFINPDSNLIIDADPRTKSVDGPGITGGARDFVGAIYDAKRGWYVALNWGGHATFLDNSTHAMDVLGNGLPVGDTPAVLAGGAQKWSRWTNPTPSATQASDGLPGTYPNQTVPDVYSDGKPSTTHSYGGLQHALGDDGSIDLYVCLGGIKWSGQGDPFTSTMHYNPVTKTWTRTLSATPLAGLGGAIASIWDPYRKVLLIRDLFDLWEYNPLSPGYVQRTNDGIPKGPIDESWSAAFDRRRYRMYMAGVLNSSYIGLTYYIMDPNTGLPIRGTTSDPNPGQYLQLAPINLAAFPTLTGAYGWWGSPGLLVDDVRDRIVLYKGEPISGGGNSRNTLFFINPDTWAISTETSTLRTVDSVDTGTGSKFRYVVSEDVYIDCVDHGQFATAGVWVYRPADQSRVYGMPNMTPEKWFGESGITRFDHGNGSAGGRAGGVATSSGQANKFERPIERDGEVVLFGGNSTYLGHPQTRGSNPVIKIKPATANAGNGQVADQWTSLTELCEGPAKSQPSLPENPSVSYDGPQIGTAAAARDLFYLQKGGAGADAGSPDTASCAGGFAATPLYGDAVLNPVTPAWGDARSAPYNWLTPFWGLGGDPISTGATPRIHRPTDSSYRLFQNGSGIGPGFCFIERRIAGTSRYVGYAMGVFDHGNGELAELRNDDLHRERIELDVIGWKAYVVNFMRGKLLEIDIRAMVTRSDSAPGANDAGHNSAWSPTSQATDWCKQYTIPGYLHAPGIGGFDGTHQHCAIGFSELHRRVILPLVGGTAGDVYALLGFNVLTKEFESYPITSTDYPAASSPFLPGNRPQGDWGVWLSKFNMMIIGGGKGSGNPYANSPTWTPASGPFVVAKNTINAVLDALSGDPGLDHSVVASDDSAVYTRGTHYNAVDNGTTITFTNIGGMAATVKIPYQVQTPTAFTRFRPYGGPTTGTPVSGNPTPSLTPPAAPSGAAAGTAGPFTVTLNGLNFMPGGSGVGSVANFDGSPRVTRYLSANTLEMDLTTADLASANAGNHLLSVTNPSPGGGTSNAVNFGVTQPPATLDLAFNGKSRDRVGPGSFSLASDGAADGVFTMTLHGTGGRTITNLRLDSSAPGVWRTDQPNPSFNWVLGVALTLDGAYMNDPSTMAVNFPLADNGTCVVFASDQGSVEFAPGRVCTITATFADGSTSQATVTIPGPGNPVLTSVTPTSGPAGQAVTLVGSAFGATQGTSTVQVGTTAASIASWSDTTIHSTIPPSLAPGVYSVTVTTAGGTTGPQSFTIPPPTPPPVVLSSVVPNTGPAGQSVVLTGSAFGASQGASTVTVGGIGAAISTWSDTLISCDIPPSLTPGVYSVIVTTVAGGASNPQSFTIPPPPAPMIISLTPTSGPALQQVVISGNDFGQVQAGGSVLVGIAMAAIISWVNNSITCRIPTLAPGPYAVTVTTANGTSAPKTFTVTGPSQPVPVITSIAPDPQVSGGVVTVIGSGFGPVQGGSVILIGGQPAGIVTWSDSQIIARIPSRLLPSTYNVTVTTTGGTSSPDRVQVILLKSGTGGPTSSSQWFKRQQDLALNRLDAQLVGQVARWDSGPSGPPPLDTGSGV